MYKQKRNANCICNQRSSRGPYKWVVVLVETTYVPCMHRKVHAWRALMAARRNFVK